MKHGYAMHRLLLALSLLGLVSGATILSPGMCGGGGGRYDSPPLRLAAK